MSHTVYAGSFPRPYHADPVDVAFGIYPWHATSGGSLQAGALARTPRPGWLALHPRLDVLYAVNELAEIDGTPGGAVTAFAIEPEGDLRHLNTIALGEATPCHCAVDGSGHFLLVSTFHGGTVHVLALGAEGAIGAQRDIQRHRGSSVHRRQDRPHPHSVNIHTESGLVYVPDLGTDTVEVYVLDDEGRLHRRSEARAELPPGSGPRHMVLHDELPMAYVVNEIAATITAFERDTRTGALRERQTVPVVPLDSTGFRSAAALVMHPAGRVLLSTIRSHGTSGPGDRPGRDEVVSYVVEPASGLLREADRVASGGAIARAAALTPEGDRVLVANQGSGSITGFRLDAADGALTALGELAASPVPVCLTVRVGP